MAPHYALSGLKARTTKDANLPAQVNVNKHSGIYERIAINQRPVLVV